MSVQVINNIIPQEICKTLIDKSNNLLVSEHMVMKTQNPGASVDIKKSTGDVKFKDLQQEGVELDFGKADPDEYINLVRPNYEEYQGYFEPVLRTEKELKSLENDDKAWIDAAISHCVALVTDKMTEFYGVKIVPDQGGLVKMKTGSHNGMHYDQRNPFTEETKKELPPEAQPKLSEYSFLIYLNTCDDDYTGGELSFPQHDLVVKPKEGMAVFFIGDPDHMHEVWKVKSGNRYSLLGFASEKDKPFQV